MIDLLPSDEQQQIIDSVAGFLAGEMPLTRLRPGPDGERPAGSGLSAGQWRRITEFGWFGLGVSEALGGGGCDVIAEMLVARELGRYAASPAIAATMAAAHLAAHADREILAGIMAGEARVAIANRVSVEGDEYHLIDGHDAAYFLVAGGRGARLYEAAAFGEAQSVLSLDDAIILERARLAAGARPQLHDASDDVAQRVSLLNSAQMLGVAEGALKLTADYARVREQFGQAIGSFQAIKHRCADMAVRAEAAYAQTFFAGLSTAAARPDAAWQVAAAKVVSAAAALANARSCIQVHGGIGFTAECDAHVFLKRAHLLGQLGGERRWVRRTLLAKLP